MTRTETTGKSRERERDGDTKKGESKEMPFSGQECRADRSLMDSKQKQGKGRMGTRIGRIQNVRDHYLRQENLA